MELRFTSVEEGLAGETWKGLAERHWPAYEHWFLSEGLEVRPTYAECVRKLKAHMPEIVPLYEEMCELAGGGDLVARFLSLYRPPAYMTGCSQVVWTGEHPLLIRNYDYAPALCEGVIAKTAWTGSKVLAMVDCMWGALDGINEHGLAVSLTFGGRRVVGDGFGVPIILRYILEFCQTAKEAGEVMRRVPTHMAYNVTALDRSGAFMTAMVAPDKEPRIKQIPIAANHQGRIDWHDYARATATLERERFLFFRLQDDNMTAERLIDCFGRPPLYSTAYGKGFGTLYTAVYNPATGEARYIWPDGELRQSFSRFTEGLRHQRFYPEDQLPNAVSY